MGQIFQELDALRHFSVTTAQHWLDIAIVTYLIYRVLLLIRGTRAWRIMLGIIAFVVMLLLSRSLHLDTLNWLLDKAVLLGPVALVILFLPEIRQTLETFGRLIPESLGSHESHAEAQTVEELVAAVTELSSEQVGTLIVLEREASLEPFISNGVLLNARLSSPLLQSIFYEGNPLHDGAVIVRKSVIVAAACRLPLSESTRISPNVHMRHRAGVGVTEGLDCLAIIVSEERGTISIASAGKLVALSGPQALREVLNAELRGDKPRSKRISMKPRKPKPLEGDQK